MEDTIRTLPIAEIDAEALPRDRSLIDADALDELKASIAATGLRQPIEVFRREGGYGLISGYRRLMAVRSLAEAGRAPTIAAILRPAEKLAEAFARVVEENDIRQSLSPWERGRTLIVARDEAGFESIDAALAALYPGANRRKQGRLRMLAEVFEALDGWIDLPEAWSENRLMRLGQALRLGWGKLIYTALEEARPGGEWEAVAPVVAECEALPLEERSTPDRPRRLVHIPWGLTVRRERVKSGYLLHITGRRATDPVVGEVLEQIERWFQP